MKIQTDLSNQMNQEFRSQLISNFLEIDKSLTKLEKLSSGDNAPTRDEMLHAIQGVRDLIYAVVVGSDKGDSSIEVMMSRRSISGKEYETLSKRLDGFERMFIKMGVDPNE